MISGTKGLDIPDSVLCGRCKQPHEVLPTSASRSLQLVKHATFPNHSVMSLDDLGNELVNCSRKFTSTLSAISTRRPITVHGYIVVVTDDYSRYRWAFCIAIKGDAHQTVINFVTWAKVHCEPLQVASIRIDQGTKFDIKVFNCSAPPLASTCNVRLHTRPSKTESQRHQIRLFSPRRER